MKRILWLVMTFAVPIVVAQISLAQTNSYISTTDGFWDEARLWSLAAPPSITQSGIFITNAASVNVTIDNVTASEFPETLTISNLTVLAPFGSTKTLYLEDTGTNVLHVLNNFNIGFNPGSPPGSAVAVISSNSNMIVDGLLGGQLQDDGTLVVMGGSLISTNCSLQVGVAMFDCCERTGLMILSNAVVQSRDVAIATGNDTSTGTIEVYGGSMTLSSTLTINNGGENSLGNMLVASGALLIVTNGSTEIADGSQGSGTLTVSNASFFGLDVFLRGSRGGATLVINSGSVTLAGKLVVGLGDESDGNLSLNGGMLVVTNDTTTIGNDSGVASMGVSDGVFLGQAVLVQQASLSIQGGRSVLSSNLQILGFANCFVASGQLFVTNASMIVDALSQCTISGGLLAAQTMEVGVSDRGTLAVNGGSITASTGITLGNCNAISGTGYGMVDGGALIVTNAAHTGYVDIQNGQLTVTNGLLQVDQLVMTNSCSQFIDTGGTLLVGKVILDPNEFQIVSVTRQSNDVLVSWLMAPGATNALQAANGSGYSTNGFTDIFVVTNNTSAGVLTNYLDVGGATNKSRYYRARLGL